MSVVPSTPKSPLPPPPPLNVLPEFCLCRHAHGATQITDTCRRIGIQNTFWSVQFVTGEISTNHSFLPLGWECHIHGIIFGNTR